MISPRGLTVAIKELINSNKLSILLILGGLVLIGLGLIYPKLENYLQIQPQPKFTKASLVVDIGGAVQNPGVYELSSEDKNKEFRVQDVIDEAGGFITEADLDWVSKNINLATVLEDGMKVYIPKIGEQKAVSASLENSSSSVLGVTNLVSLNTATEAELDKLPSVGPVTAAKIIASRPYGSINELVDKKIVPKATFEKIKSMIKTQ
jgi:competence protein ComEA